MSIDNGISMYLRRGEENEGEEEGMRMIKIMIMIWIISIKLPNGSIVSSSNVI